jgi:hypothetical protein
MRKTCCGGCGGNVLARVPCVLCGRSRLVMVSLWRMPPGDMASKDACSVVVKMLGDSSEVFFRGGLAFDADAEDFAGLAPRHLRKSWPESMQWGRNRLQPSLR